jgi:hypothetical protein
MIFRNKSLHGLSLRRFRDATAKWFISLRLIALFCKVGSFLPETAA